MGHGVRNQPREVVEDGFDGFRGFGNRGFNLGQKISGRDIWTYRAVTQASVIVACPIGGAFLPVGQIIVVHRGLLHYLIAMLNI